MSSGVIFVAKPPRASILAYASREPRRNWIALTLAVNAMSLDGFASITMSSSNGGGYAAITAGLLNMPGLLLRSRK
jgi:hypothetical protein